MRTTRRDFAKGLSGAALAAAFRHAKEPARLPIAFSTLGCPGWDMQKILNFAEQHGFAAIEFRGLEGSLDLPSHPAFATERIAETKREILSRGLGVACVSSSASLHESDAEKRSRTLADAQRFIDLASSLDAPYVRVFGSSPDSGHPVSPSDDLKMRVAAGLHALGDYAGPLRPRSLTSCIVPIPSQSDSCGTLTTRSQSRARTRSSPCGSWGRGSGTRT